MKNADLIVQMLERAGIRWAFGIPSGPVLPIIEALRKSSIEYVLTASETSAAFMAQAVGAFTGVPGVCISTLGPGATNLTTGVGAAWLDRTPLIAITCNVPIPWLERRIQMRIDHHALFQPLTKASLPLREGHVAGPLSKALTIACAEPPGPVHLDLPEDVAAATATETILSPKHADNSLPDISAEVASKTAKALAQSKRPLLIAGLTFTRSKAPESLLRFIERQRMPYVLTLHAKGFLPEKHANYMGVIGRARRSDVQTLVQQADLILAIGYDPIEINYEEWVGNIPIIHISTEVSEISSQVNVLLDAGGDMDGAIKSLAQLPALPNEWTPQQWQTHRERLEQNLRPHTQSLALHQVLDILRKKLPDDGILVYDVGAHTHQIAAQWRTNLPWTCNCTNGWSSMGYGLPAAYAAKMVYPQRTVVGVVGDGCFQMTVGEVTVAKRRGLAVPIIVLNDGWLSLLKVKQERKGYELSGVHLGEPVDPPSHYFGVPCHPARDTRELTDALQWGLTLDGPSIIETFVDPESYSLTIYD
ncbi:MAG TPA: thiamine pyrophosphate-binding protein [Candidatus Bathyarchaeia archaeon]|nr:thiamine pyrophosphate-binding protein [Candidatus Bathyarchaeia archaeon]